MSTRDRAHDVEMGLSRYDVPTPSSVLAGGSSNPGYRAGDVGDLAEALLMTAARPRRGLPLVVVHGSTPRGQGI